MVTGNERWWDLIAEKMAQRPVPVVGMTPLQPFGGYSDAVAIDCDDGRRYIVKGIQVNRALIADQVVGQIGAAIGAPVAEVALVDVPTELIVEDSYLDIFGPGLGHGSLFIPDCLDSRDVLHQYEAENESRFALLSVLYGWAHPDDHQFLYRKGRPHLVHSVDHGHFLAGGPNWDAESLSAAPMATIDTWIASQAGCSRASLQTALERLRAVTDATIAQAVAAPPDEWGITTEQRLELAAYLADRRDQLVAAANH